MQWRIPETAYSELAAAVLQTAVTLALAAVCLLLWRRYRKAAFLYFAVAWTLYTARLVAILSFLVGHASVWLFWHQVTTGWTALALLWAALAFAQRVRWRWAYLTLVVFPVVWSYVAIYRLDNFLLAAGPAVLFLSGATLLTAWAFYRHARSAHSGAAAFLSVALVLWAAHHLDYPFLRARGIWNPVGYYLDIAFVLAMGLGILLLVQEDLGRGLRTLSSLSAVLQPRERGDMVLDQLLRRLLTLPAVQGSAIALRVADGGRVVRGAGACEPWDRAGLPERAWSAMEMAERSGRPQVVHGAGRGAANGSRHGYVAALPVLHGEEVRGAMIVVGEARNPFAALDADFLVALGQQAGAALANAELYTGLVARSTELEALAARMVRRDEEERRRLARELHDETAQVFAAVSLQLGLARERAGAEVAPRLDRALALVNEGIRGIRRVTEDLRPTLLDELGLLPALRALVDAFGEQEDTRVRFEAPAALPPISEEAELALFRALQEALANVTRHAGARSVEVGVAAENGRIALRVIDDGRGIATEALAAAARAGRMGLVGMRERVLALGGELKVETAPGGGAALRVSVPVSTEAA
jgi:signal transduction histidine kinase